MYDFLIFLVCVIGLSIGYKYLIKYMAKRGIDNEDVTGTLDTTKLVLDFIKVMLNRKVGEGKIDGVKIKLYTELIIEGVEYMKILSYDIPTTEKIDMGMDSIVDIACNLDIMLTDDEIRLIREVLIVAYDLYLGLTD